MMKHIISGPMTPDIINRLTCGDIVEYSGVILTARDEAHQRLVGMLERQEILPIDLSTAIIFYAGPAPTPPHMVSGSIGPTTSIRMDGASLKLLDAGLRVMIGKGKRSDQLIEQMKQTKSIYFGAIGGSAAILAQTVKSSRIVAFEDLGPEAIHELVVEHMPLIVLIDSCGGNLYVSGRQKYLTGKNNENC